MLVFNDRHFLRHISMPTLREFTQQHKISPKLNIDWEAAAETLHALVGKELDRLEESLVHGALEVESRKDLEHDLMLWHDDLKRANAMSNAQAVQEFRCICADDPLALAAFDNRTEREIALWMLAFRDKAFRDAELHLAFQAKTNGKFWKKHLIPAGSSSPRIGHNSNRSAKRSPSSTKKWALAKAVMSKSASAPRTAAFR